MRIVGLPVQVDREGELRKAFDDAYLRIRELPGCAHLALVRGDKDDLEYLTLSLWESPEALDAYRKSSLFASIWPRIRSTLRAEPWARSYEFSAGDGPWGAESGKGS